MAKKPKIGGLLDDVAEKVIKPEPQGIRAYHGSPHDFDRFDLSKIGTGEGAQAYGHGLYFAEAEPIAKGYRDRIAGAQWIDKRGIPVQTNDIVEDIEREARKSGLGIVDAQNMAFNWRDFVNNPANAPDPIKKVLDQRGVRLDSKGHMYEVNIRANPEDFLDWDKPLVQQSQNVVDFARKVNPDLVEYAMERGYGQDPLKVSPLGQDLWGRMTWKDSGNPDVSSQLAPRAAQRLNEQGIPGIKYLDAGSRAAGDGSRNYVVFDDALIDIIRKYGIVPGGLLGAGYAMSPSDAEAAPKVPRPRVHGPSLTDAIDTALPSQPSQLSQARPDWIGENGAITANPPWLRPDPNERSTLGKVYDAVTTNPLGTVKAVGGALGDAVKDYAKSVYANPSKGAADALELGVTAMGGAAPQAFWMATSPSEANGGEDAILADRRRKMMQGLLAD